jgi:hypothetical protein
MKLMQNWGKAIFVEDGNESGFDGLHDSLIEW